MESASAVLKTGVAPREASGACRSWWCRGGASERKQPTGYQAWPSLNTILLRCRLAQANSAATARLEGGINLEAAPLSPCFALEFKPAAALRHQFLRILTDEYWYWYTLPALGVRNFHYVLYLRRRPLSECLAS